MLTQKNAIRLLLVITLAMTTFACIYRYCFKKAVTTIQKLEQKQEQATKEETAADTKIQELPTPLQSVSQPIPQKITIKAPTILQKDPLYWDWQAIDTDNIYFPTNFLWGAATSAHQVEGNCINNDWSVWEQQEEDVAFTGQACDQWNRYTEDIELIKKAGLNTYRFSIEWSKIEPKEGCIDHHALKHYQDLCKELVSNGIKPVVTLHHYTNPLWFAQKNGFEKEENIKHYVQYCKLVFERLHPYVHLWLTFNSPTSYVARAYHAHLNPPGKKDTQLMQEVLKNMLEAHVQVYQALKKMPHGDESQIGICHNIYQVEPKHFWDKAGCNTGYTLFNQNIYTFFTTGHFKVSVPFTATVNHYNAAAPRSLDFIGLNYYSHGLMTNFDIDQHPNEIPTQIKIYTIYPEGFYRALMEVTKELATPLHIPIYMTENGIATTNEHHRKLFFERYLYTLSYAISSGCPVQGYIVWSLLDNYEWGSYDMNFGLYAVDFDTQKRSHEVRRGAQYYLDVVKRFTY